MALEAKLNQRVVLSREEIRHAFYSLMKDTAKYYMFSNFQLVQIATPIVEEEDEADAWELMNRTKK